MELLSLSYLRNALRKSGMVFTTIIVSPTASRGTTATNTQARLPPITNAITKLNISISGERITRRMRSI